MPTTSRLSEAAAGSALPVRKRGPLRPSAWALGETSSARLSVRKPPAPVPLALLPLTLRVKKPALLPTLLPARPGATPGGCGSSLNLVGGKPAKGLIKGRY